MTYYSIYNLKSKTVRTDYAYYRNQQQLQLAFEKHLRENRDKYEESVDNLLENTFQVIETPLDNLINEDINVLRQVVKGDDASVENGWYDEFNQIVSEDIKAIVEFKEHGFAGSWYIVFRYRDQPLKIKHPINPVNTSRMMKDFDIYNKHTVYEMSHQSHMLN